MKKLWVSFSVLIAILLLSQGCSQTGTQTSPKYTPQYSAEQVTAVVKTQYPDCYKYEGGGQYSTAPTGIKVEFVGGTSHAWKATVTCQENYYAKKGTGLSSLTVYFWETDGALHDNYVP